MPKVNPEGSSENLEIRRREGSVEQPSPAEFLDSKAAEAEGRPIGTKRETQQSGAATVPAGETARENGQQDKPASSDEDRIYPKPGKGTAWVVESISDHKSVMANPGSAVDRMGAEMEEEQRRETE
ncbi:MAG: hypothetical protein HYV13_00450 [Candidatus Doudnabacteria bacterium]|nr:hypothetical protein [Candidatus Doudnabacteria bacterium]